MSEVIPFHPVERIHAKLDTFLLKAVDSLYFECAMIYDEGGETPDALKIIERILHFVVSQGVDFEPGSEVAAALKRIENELRKS